MDALPPIIVGTSHLGTVVPLPLGEGDAFTYLDRMVELGLTAFDIAASYQIGGTERLFGRWLTRRGGREDVFLISKGGHPLPIVAPHRLGRRALENDLHASLRRLRTDVIDLYFLHRDDEHTPLEEIARTLGSFVAAGKIRGWGLSNWHHERIAALSRAAESVGAPPPQASSPHFSLFGWQKAPWPGCVSITDDADALAFYREHDLPVLGWSPVARGFLATPPKNLAVYGGEVNAGRRARLLSLAESRGESATALALAYLGHHGFAVHPVVASRRPERMAANLEAMSLPLSEAEVRWLEVGGALEGISDEEERGADA